MLFSTIGQHFIFLWMLGAGLGVGAVYSLFRGLRRLFQAGRPLTLLLDALFGLCAAGCIIAASLFADYGQLRFYQLAAAGAGVVLYRWGVDPPVQKFFRTLGNFGRRACHILSKSRLIKVIFK